MDGNEGDDCIDPDLSNFFTNTEYTVTDLVFPTASADTYHISLAASPSACCDYDLTGQVLWPVSKLLAHYVAKQCPLIHGANVLELGAGTGLPGLVAASAGAARVVLTDGNALVLDLLKRNVALWHEKHGATTCQLDVRPLVWGQREDVQQLQQQHSIDLILSADVVQWPAMVEPLLHTVHALLYDNGGSDAVSGSNQSRKWILGIVNRAANTYNSFFAQAKDLGFACRQVPMHDVFADGVVPMSCRERGGHETELFELWLDPTRAPLPHLLHGATTDDTTVGDAYQNNASVPY